MASPIKEIITVAITKNMDSARNFSGQPLNHEFYLVRHQNGEITAWDWEKFPVTDEATLLLLSTVAQQLLKYDADVRNNDRGFQSAGSPWEQLPDVSGLINSMNYLVMIQAALHGPSDDEPEDK